MIMVVLTALMLICILIPGMNPSVVMIPFGLLMCTGIVIFAGAILAAVRRNSNVGAACGANDASILDELDGEISFADNANTLKTLMIMQFVFLCPLNCCTMCGGWIGTMVLTLNKIKQSDDYQRIN